MSRLCPVCKQIPFSTLTCPTASDICKAHELQKKGRNTVATLVPFHNFSDVTLGSLGSIRARAQGCQLCSIFYDTIKRRGSWYANGRPIPEDDDNIIIRTQCDWFHTYVTETVGSSSLTSRQSLVVLRRLGLLVQVAAETEIDGVSWAPHVSLAYYTNVVQPCYLDDFIRDPGPDPTSSLDGQPRLLFSARKRPETVDPQLLLRWMNICLKDHDLSCSVEEYEQQPPSRVELIRFIDVDRNCICVLRDVDLVKTRYLALSYCWGRDQEVKLNAENEQRFQLENAIPERLPRTIQDAIHLCRLLGFKHLWVDVLCIFQGQGQVDRQDRATQLSNMRKIYQESNATIVAACGDTADAGLSGLRPGTRTFKQQAVEVISTEDDPVLGGLALVSTCVSSPPWTYSTQGHSTHDEDLEWGAWGSRAWTFQEHALSRRRILFTPEQVHWSCDGAIFCEESHYEPPSLYERGVFDLPLHVQMLSGFGLLSTKTIDGYLARLTTNRQNLWNKFDMNVRTYTERQMAYEGDVYNAFEGVLEAFTNLSGETFHWGHPRSRFPLSLLWRSPGSYTQLRRRTAETTLPMTSLNKTVRLPSWSWMGWVGSIQFSVGQDRAESESPMITCFEHHSFPLRVTQVIGSNRFDAQETVSEKVKAETPKPAWSRGCDDEVTVQSIQECHPNLTETFLQQQPDGHIIFFWASTTFLDVQRPRDLTQDPTAISYTARDRGIVRNRKGEPVGTVDTMGPSHWNQTPDPSGLQEFVAVGRRAVAEIPDLPAVVLALQIRWENGLASRVNIAEIEETAWIAAEPAWKLIALR